MRSKVAGENKTQSKSDGLDFRLKSFNETITRNLEKELKTDGEDVLVLGYVQVPKILNKEVLNRVRTYSERLFGAGCGVYAIHPNDVLSDITGKKVSVDTNVRYCVIYRQN